MKGQLAPHNFFFVFHKAHGLLPEAVRERLHCKLGDAVSATVCCHPAQHRRHVDNTASGLFDEWQEDRRHGNTSIHVDFQCAVVILHFHPL